MGERTTNGSPVESTLPTISLPLLLQMTGVKGLSLKKFRFVDVEGLVRLVMSVGAEHKLACASARTMVGQCPGEGSGNKAVEEEGSS